MARKYRIRLLTFTLAIAAVMAFAGAGECAKAVAKKSAKTTTPAKSAAATSGPKSLKIVAVRGFEQMPASGSSKISIVMCPEETSPATFAVRAAKSIPGVKVAPATDLSGPGKIGRENIEISRLDGEALIGDTTANLGSQPVQYWVDVTIPRGVKPGTYTGAIGFYQQNKLIDSMRIEVKVLPLRLLGSSRQFGIYTTYGPGPGATQMDANTFVEFAKAFEKTGYKFVSMDVNTADAQQVMSSYTAAGLGSPVCVTTWAFSDTVPSRDDVVAMENARKASGQGASFYFVVDNPTTDQQAATAQQQMMVIKSAYGRSAVRITDESVLPKISQYLDAVDYPVTSQYVQSMMNGTGKRTDKWEWFWWDARKSVTDNRLYSGVGLWKSGLYGVMPVWMPEEGKAPTEGLNSLQGEALREGVTDTRYITTYMRALRELKDLKRAKDKDYIAETEAYLAKFMAKPLGSITPTDLYSFRAKMAGYSLKLASML